MRQQTVGLERVKKDTRRAMKLDILTSERLGAIAMAENPKSNKLGVVKSLVDKRYDELVRQGRIKV